MAASNLSDFLLFINCQIKVQEQIETNLWKLEALIKIAVMADDFYDGVSEKVLRNYFSVAHDLIKKSVQANQTGLYELMKHIKYPINENV